MNEETKNIETCLPESILAEVASVPTDEQFVSLVNEALDPLQQQAFPPAAREAYKETVMYHRPYTFASQVAQMKSNLILLLRRLWRYPFGRGTLRSLSDMWQHYITRLHGNATYGIPSRLSSLSDLPSAPLLLSDRKISGVPEAVDGISLVNLLCSSAASEITELTDDNTGWTMTQERWRSFIGIFTNTKRILLGCVSALADFHIYMPSALEELIFPDLEYYKHSTQASHNSYIISGNMKKVGFPKLKTYLGRDGGYGTGLLGNLPNLEEFHAPVMERFGQDSRTAAITNCPKLKVADFRSLVAPVLYSDVYSIGFDNCNNLIHLEFKAYNSSSNMSQWSPTNALDASRTDLIEEGSTATNNLQQFLSNFKAYIAERIATFTANGPTLTLSQAVYDAIKDESHLFVFDEGTMTIYAYMTNVKHWTVTK